MLEDYNETISDYSSNRKMGAVDYMGSFLFRIILASQEDEIKLSHIWDDMVSDLKENAPIQVIDYSNFRRIYKQFIFGLKKNPIIVKFPNGLIFSISWDIENNCPKVTTTK